MDSARPGQAAISSARVTPGKAEIEVAGQAPLGVAVEHRCPAPASRMPARKRRRRASGGSPPPPSRAWAIAAASPSPTKSGVGKVPERMPRSCPPPSISARDARARPAAHIERADALRARRSCGRRSTQDRSPSHRHRTGFFRPPAPRRCGTARPRTRRCARDLGERLDHADLVMRRHHRDDRGALVERAPSRLEIDQAVALDRQEGHAEPLALQRLRRFRARIYARSRG